MTTRFGAATEVGRIVRSDTERIVVRVLDDGSVDVRQWIATGRYSGPTTKGFLLTGEEARALGSLLTAL